MVNAGRRAGLEPLGYSAQGQFLRNLGFDQLRRRVALTPMPEEQATANRAGLLALTRGGGLGGFRVLLQSKGLSSSVGGPQEIWGFAPGSVPERLLQDISLPLLSSHHISLPQGWPQPAPQEFTVNDLMAGFPGDI